MTSHKSQWPIVLLQIAPVTYLIYCSESSITEFTYNFPNFFWVSAGYLCQILLGFAHIIPSFEYSKDAIHLETFGHFNN